MKRTVAFMFTCMAGAALAASASGQHAGAPGPAQARTQTQTQPQTRQANAQAQAQALLDAYSARGAHAAPDETIGMINAKGGLAPTAANVATVRRLLAGALPTEDKLSLIRIMGRLYTPDDASGANGAIVRDLKLLSGAGDETLARVALLTYSRMGYRGDTFDLLGSARARRLLDDDAYCQELAMGLAYVPAQLQPQWVGAIARTAAPLCAPVLTFVINDPVTRAGLGAEARGAALAFLAQHEPAMPMALGQFGLGDAMGYADWLDAIAQLTSKGDPAAYARTVLNRLNERSADPRKLLGFFGSRHAQMLVKQVGHRGPFAAAAARAGAYAAQFPGHPVMIPMVAEMRQLLATVPD